MELNREQIIKALECCIEGECDGCTYDEQTSCKEYLLNDAISLIKELTEENERLRAESVAIPEGGIGNLSDGYHTFNELYHHRAILFSVICNSMPDKAWKSKLHDTGDMYDGMFIVGIETPEGQATYHYDIDPYWDMFKVRELEKAPKWDGHTPQVAIERISQLTTNVAEVVRCKNCKFCTKLDVVDVCNHDKTVMINESNPKRVHLLVVGREHYCSYGERRGE